MSANASRGPANASGVSATAPPAPAATSTHLAPVAALTSVWTPPCGLDRWYKTVTDQPVPESCLLPSWSAYWFRTGIGYYSPAICPSGFAVCHSRYDSGQGPEPLPGETAMLCAKIGYSCGPPLTYFAQSMTGGVITTQPLIQIRWQSSDLSILATPPLETTRTTDSLISASPTGNGGPTEPLSTGAKAGIGVGVAAVVLLACAVAVLFLRRYRAERLRGASGEEATGDGPPELDAVGRPPLVAELGAAAPPMAELGPPYGHSPASAAGNAQHPGKTLLPPELDPYPRQETMAIELPAGTADRPPTTTWPGTPANPPMAYPSASVSPASPPPVRKPVPEYSALPEVVDPHPDVAALESLREQQAHLERERLRILRLHEIEQEQARLQRRISEFGSRGSASPGAS